MLKRLPHQRKLQEQILTGTPPQKAAIAVVGCGYWGSKHVRVLAGMKDVSQVIAVEANAGLRRQIETSFPNVRTAASLAEVLHEVDGVVVATPPHNHVDVALEALKAGVHVLIEKPIATSLKDATRILEAAQTSGAIVMAGHTYEFNPVVHELRRRIRAGELGEIRYIHSSRLNLGLYRTDVNVVWDLAPHDVSIMNFLLDETPRSVTAWGFSCAAKSVIDVAHYQLEYARSNVVGHGFNSWIDPRKVRQLTIVGSRKMAIFDDIADEKLRIFDHHVDLPLGFGVQPKGAMQPPVHYARGDVVSPSIEYGEPLQLEDQNFVNAICGRDATLTDGMNGREVVKVLEAIDQSMASGTPALVDSDFTPHLN